MKKALLPSQELALHEIFEKITPETMPSSVIATNNKSAILYWNKASEKLYGWKSHEVIGKFESEVLRTRFLNTTIEEYSREIKTKGFWESELVQYRKNGDRIYTLSSAKIIRDARGHAVGTIFYNRDITRLKQVEYNLRFLSSAFRALSGSLDYQTTLNQVAELAVPRMADWCSVELLKDNGELEHVALAHKDPEKVKFALQLRQKFPADLNTPQGIGQVIRTGKSELYTHITDKMVVQGAKNPEHLAIMKKIGFSSAMIVPIISREKPIGAISFVAAESRRHYTELDLQTAEKLASRASLAIENARLYKSAEQEIAERKKVEAQLREMENRKNNFISMASHELKTPITSLKIYRDLLERRLPTKEQKEFVQILTVMNKQINKLSILISDLLDLSKIRVGKLDFKMDVFNLNDLVDETVFEIQPTTHHKITVKHEKRVLVFGDRERINQVLINLLTNAIKYSPESNKVIVTVTTQDECGTVKIRDYGIGVRKKDRERIFERFYQAEENETFPGLGIGLNISQEIVTRHGGKLWVEKGRSKGSVFIFTVPRKQYHEKSSYH
jgi:PAS domain S-box-containing protein